MTVNELSSREEFSAVSMPEGEREISGVYIGDLLSWVMGRARENCAWITIMSNVNIVAVASLADVSCVILSEGVSLEESVIKTAADKGVNILSTSLNSYEAAALISEFV